MTYTEEEKKQLKMAFGRMLDNDEDFLAIDIAEVEGRDLVPYIARKRFRVSLITSLSSAEKNTTEFTIIVL